MTEPDTTEKLERTEDVPELSEVREIRETVEREMKFARMNQPDAEDDE